MAEEAILGHLEKNVEISDSGDFASQSGIDHNEIVNVIKSLHGFRLVDAQDIKREKWVLTDEGKLYAAAGSPEVQLFLAVPPEGISREELQRKVDPSVYKIGCSQAIKNKWLEIGKQQVSRKVQQVEDTAKDLLTRIQNEEALSQADIDALKRRKLIALQTWKGYSVRKGPNYAPKRKKVATDLTRENLQRGDWKELEFKEYNFNAKGQSAEGGHLHPLLKVRRQLQMIFLQMGFEEMPTNNFVESSFWNFDALFQPQQHPARDSHDTFFLQAPSTTKMLPEDYVERVKHVHEHGGYGSRGYGYDWKREEANKNLLRTHTTAVSSRMLYLLAQVEKFLRFIRGDVYELKPFAPKKYYSIDRVFRNEAVDRTHLAEFHQIEGLVCDRGLTLGDLIGVLQDFFSRLGMSQLRFKPAYNPYTEPSMEIFSYHEGLKKWVEIGNSGMFRPEMLLPMGLPEDVRVIAWGLSLERPTMILYGVDNIRDLFGHKVDLGLIKRNPICRLGIEQLTGLDWLLGCAPIGLFDNWVLYLFARRSDHTAFGGPLGRDLGKGLKCFLVEMRDILGRKISTSPSTGAGFSCMKCRIGLVPVQTSTRLPLHSKEFLNRRQPPPTTKIR
ncbi:Phenylalanine--tRNA ligase alpha subunit, cytoplasmic [Vitis vinifera]|uniref:phenylalanine--tRNA ligase n=1 Tax=Vitis vinifera TaxID=29760 RepID=A0A438JTY7_VITVI|nr:Phenylalanine--tRNA ligase alpha subunit, cytoplasmic [Vitis vinifera]